jgi:MFS transporter, MHS family, proline/betaine transporter
MNNVDTFSSLSKHQKEAAALLSIGTFLEYFDLMIYVHMATLLNELFFPKTDAHTAALLQAVSFCSTFVFRPIGALIFGYIGDTISRKSTVIVTTTMMSISCVIMATLPTYSQIGIVASWAVTGCRIAQGMSCMGEIIGAELYLTEITKPPLQYPLVGILGLAGVVGSVAALGVANIVLGCNIGWRIAFWIGAIIAIVGAVARTTLRETPEFANAKNRIKKVYNDANLDQARLQSDPIFNQKINRKTLWALFILYCEWPICFYFIYIYCGDILKNSFGYSAEQVIKHNFTIVLVQLLVTILKTILTYKVYPLIILKVRTALFLIFILFCPYLLNNMANPSDLLWIQLIIVFLTGANFAAPIFFKHLPIFKRFTCSSLIYSVSRALIYVFTSFGVIYLIKYFNHYGFFIIAFPVSIMCYWGLCHFETLERQAGNYPHNRSLQTLNNVV